MSSANLADDSYDDIGRAVRAVTRGYVEENGCDQARQLRGAGRKPWSAGLSIGRGATYRDLLSAADANC